MAAWDTWRDAIVNAAPDFIHLAVIYDLGSSQIVSQSEIPGPQAQLQQECQELAEIMGRMAVRTTGSAQTVRTVTEDNVEMVRFLGSNFRIQDSRGETGGAAANQVAVEHRRAFFARCEGDGFFVCYQSTRTLLIGYSDHKFGSLITRNLPYLSTTLPSSGPAHLLVFSVLAHMAEHLIANQM
jgi:hypothetical protein